MRIVFFATLTICVACQSQAGRHNHHNTSHDKHWNKPAETPAQLGPRPFYLIDQMPQSDLKTALKQCEDGPFYKTDFSIGHRGAPLQFPEHTKESYVAAAKMGAGILECDVTFTKDRELVCRHSQCDLHTTTNILTTELASKCSQPFSPADPESNTMASALCCTSDITLAEFKTLCGKMDASNPNARTAEEYQGGTVNFRTDLYTSCGTLISHKESIKLFKALDVKFTPELKSPSVEMPYEGEYTQQDYAQQMIDEYKSARVHPRKVWPQSFNLDDVIYWINHNHRYGKQAVYLDSRPYEDASFVPSLSDFENLKAQGVNIIAPPMPALLQLDANNNIVPSEYAILAKAAGLEIITWTLERSGRIQEDMKNGGSFYFSTILDGVENDGDVYKTLNVLAMDVGIIGIFSDWPATTSYYANCMGLK